MGIKQEKRSTMPAKVTYGFFIRIIHIMDRHLKCSEPAVDYGTWCMCECLTTRRAAFLRGCLMNRFVQASGAPIVQ
jgi:hypothetical protein